MLKHLPALSTNRSIRLFTVTGLYFAQGIQLGLMMVALPAYLAAQGVNPAAIGGFIGAIMLPWSLKILSAPLMDRFSYLPMGRRRPWVLFGLIGAALGYIGMGLVPDPIDRLFELTMAAVVVSVFTAVMDVAVDGMAIDVLPEEEQSLANGYMWGGKVIGASATTAGAAFTLDAIGMSGSFFVAAIFTFCFALLPLLFREREGEKLLPGMSGKTSEDTLKTQMKGWGDIWRSLVKVFILPSSVLLAIISFIHGITYGFFDTIMPVLTVQELGWKDTGFSSLAAIAGLIGGVLGMTIGGRIIQAIGRVLSMKVFLITLFALAAIMGLAAGLWANKLTVDLFVVFVYTCRTLILISIFAVAMAFCWKPVAATQFALYMAIGNFGISAGASIFSAFQGFMTYPQMFYSMGIFALVAGIIVYFLNMEKHVAHLENFPSVSETKIEMAT